MVRLKRLCFAGVALLCCLAIGIGVYLTNRPVVTKDTDKQYDVVMIENTVDGINESASYMTETVKVKAIEEKERIAAEEAAREAEEARLAEEAALAEEIRLAEEARIAEERKENVTQNYSQSNGRILTRSSGVNWFNGNKETYYNLDMSEVILNAQNIGINGEYWIREDGVKMYGNYVIVAAQMDKGTIIETSLGTGIVLDWCPAGTIDIAVTW